MNIYQFKASYKLSESCTLPKYKTMKFRGIFGNAFRKLVCKNVEETNCSKCSLATNCDFASTFQRLNLNPNSVDEKYKKFSNFPPKLVFYIASKKRYWEKDEELEVIISFLGIPQIPIEMITLILMLVGQYQIDKKSNAQLILKKLIDLSNNKDIFSQKEIVNNDIQPIKFKGFDLNKTIRTINFLIHCRITNKDIRVSNDLTGTILARRIKERLKLLMIDQEKPYNCLWDINEVEIIDKDIRFEEIGHRSNRQRQKIMLGGFIGKISIKCENLNFWRDLQYLEYLHIGSNAQGGYGKFEICDDN